MSTFCTIALALGLSFDACKLPDEIDYPKDDLTVFEYDRPPAPAPAPPPPPPEVIIKEVIVEVPAEPVDVAPPAPPPPPKTGFDIEAMNQFYQQRRAGGLKLIEGNPQPLKTNAALPPIDKPPSTPAAPVLEVAQYSHSAVVGSEPVNNEKIIAEDRYITGILETSLNTQLDGSVIIQTSRDVFGYHGRTILLPKGSRFVCDYTSPKRIGDYRIGLECNRVLIAETRAEIYQIAAPVSDPQGRIGITGEVDNRFIESYGAAFNLTILSASIRAAIAASNDDTATDSNDTILSEAGEEISTRFGEITASVLQKSLNLQPIITIPQGTRVQIRPASDWYIKTTAR